MMPPAACFCYSFLRGLFLSAVCFSNERTTDRTNDQAQEQLIVLQGVAAEKEKAEESAEKAKAEAAKAIEGAGHGSIC